VTRDPVPSKKKITLTRVGKKKKQVYFVYLFWTLNQKDTYQGGLTTKGSGPTKGEGKKGGKKQGQCWGGAGKTKKKK